MILMQFLCLELKMFLIQLAELQKLVAKFKDHKVLYKSTKFCVIQLPEYSSF